MNFYFFVALGALVYSSVSARPDGFRVRFNQIKALGKEHETGDQCTEEEIDEALENIEEYKECNKLLDDCDAALCPDSEFFNLTCTGNCFKTYTTFYRQCNFAADEQAYYANCGIGPGGDRCITIDVMQLRGENPALESALSNCPSIASSDCTDSCKQSIERGRDIYGCCLNDYLNDSVVAEYYGLSSYSYLVSYDLWSACGVPTDIGFCYGSAWAKSLYAVFGAALIAVLMSLMI